MVVLRKQPFNLVGRSFRNANHVPTVVGSRISL
jgi:hypothetical protein